jgi:hypothetical protein
MQAIEHHIFNWYNSITYAYIMQNVAVLFSGSFLESSCKLFFQSVGSSRIHHFDISRISFRDVKDEGKIKIHCNPHRLHSEFYFSQN